MADRKKKLKNKMALKSPLNEAFDVLQQQIEIGEKLLRLSIKTNNSLKAAVPMTEAVDFYGRAFRPKISGSYPVILTFQRWCCFLFRNIIMLNHHYSPAFNNHHLQPDS